MCTFYNNGIKMTENQITAVVEYPAPKTIIQLRLFLGITLWYRRVIQNYLKTTAPLTKLLKKKQRWSWDQEEAFNKIKKL